MHARMLPRISSLALGILLLSFSWTRLRFFCAEHILLVLQHSHLMELHAVPSACL